METNPLARRPPAGGGVMSESIPWRRLYGVYVLLVLFAALIGSVVVLREERNRLAQELRMNEIDRKYLSERLKMREYVDEKIWDMRDESFCEVVMQRAKKRK